MKKFLISLLLVFSLMACVGYVEVSDPYPVPPRNPVHVPRTERVICNVCHGTGRVGSFYSYPRNHNPRHRYATCRRCNGRGYIYVTVRYHHPQRIHY